VSPISEDFKNSPRDGLESSLSANLRHGDVNSKSSAPADHSNQTWYGELLHSTAYALVQNPYNGVRQIENHVSQSLLDKSFLPQMEFVSPVQERHDGGAIAIAQAVGNIAGTLPYFLAAEFITRKSLPNQLMARSVPLGEPGKRILSTAIAGGAVEGIFNPSAEDGNWMNTRAKKAAVAFTTFAVAGAAAEGLMGNSLSRKMLASVPTETAATNLLKTGLTRVNNFSIGAIGGAAGGATGVEFNSLITDGKVASASDVISGSLKTAAMMGTLSALRSSAKTGQSLSTETKIEADLTIARAENVPPPVLDYAKAVKPNARPILDEATVTTDPKQIGKMETQAQKLAEGKDYDRSAKIYAAVIDSWETLKSLGRQIDETHVRQLYRDLASVRLKGDKP